MTVTQDSPEGPPLEGPSRQHPRAPFRGPLQAALGPPFRAPLHTIRGGPGAAVAKRMYFFSRVNFKTVSVSGASRKKKNSKSSRDISSHFQNQNSCTAKGKTQCSK